MIQTAAGETGNGDPYAVIVATGSHDISRLIAAQRRGTIEQGDAGEKLLRQLRRNPSGRNALRLLADHGGPDLTFDAAELPEARDIIVEEVEALEHRYISVINALLAHAPGEPDADYWRWQGHAEKLRETATELRKRAGLPKVDHGSKEWREANGLHRAEILANRRRFWAQTVADRDALPTDPQVLRLIADAIETTGKCPGQTSTHCPIHGACQCGPAEDDLGPACCPLHRAEDGSHAGLDPADRYDQTAKNRLDDTITMLRRLEHEALRWEDPLDLPSGIDKLRVALGIDADGFGDGCDQCKGAPDRWARDHGGSRAPWLVDQDRRAASRQVTR